ncbi:MAG: hypothetical protein ACI4WM_04080 [Erysipelotrichaceae bacterium]
MVLSIFYQISWVGIETFTYKGKEYKVSDRIHRLAKLIITIYSVMIGVGTIFGYYISLIIGVTSFWQLFLIIIGLLFILAVIFELMSRRTLRKVLDNE